jgi:rubredoxin
MLTTHTPEGPGTLLGMKNADDAPMAPLKVVIRCPNCGHDFDPEGPIDRHKLYDCPHCTYEFSFSGTELDA